MGNLVHSFGILKKHIPEYRVAREKPRGLPGRMDEREFATIIFNNIPAWPFQIIIPIGFALMSFRFIISGINTLAKRKEN